MSEHAADLYREIAAAQSRGESLALCTIVNTKGSTPGKTAMKMLVRTDGSFAGTVGGGCLEAEVLEAALESIADERPRMLEFALNERDYPDSGLICGGKVEIYVEPITEARVHLFGGGHVSGAIAQIASFSGFRVSVGDDRADFATAERHPHASELMIESFEEQAARFGGSTRDFLVVCSRGHDRDGDVLSALWKAGARPRYLGMIGSRAKRATLFAKLRAEGVAEDWLAAVQSPMGLPIGARSHPEIAVSVVAEMIRVRRGAPPPPSVARAD